jgi:hypothetical protein
MVLSVMTATPSISDGGRGGSGLRCRGICGLGGVAGGVADDAAVDGDDATVDAPRSSGAPPGLLGGRGIGFGRGFDPVGKGVDDDDDDGDGSDEDDCGEPDAWPGATADTPPLLDRRELGGRTGRFGALIALGFDNARASCGPECIGGAAAEADAWALVGVGGACSGRRDGRGGGAAGNEEASELLCSGIECDSDDAPPIGEAVAFGLEC